MDTMQVKTNNAGKDMSPFARRFVQDLRAGKKFFAVLCILNLMGLPVLTVCLHSLYRLKVSCGLDNGPSAFYIQAGSQAVREYTSVMIVMNMSLLFLAAAFLSGFVSALRSFSYLHKKTETDMVFSLPVRSSSRFAADFLSGFLLYTVPLAASVIVSLVCFFALGSVSGYSLSDIISCFTEQNADADIVVINAVLCLLNVAAMLYILSVLVSVCCGKTLSTVLYMAALNAGIPLTADVCSTAVYNNLDSVIPYSESSILQTVSSPPGGIRYLIENLAVTGTYYLGYLRTGISVSLWFTLVSVINIVMIVMSFVIYIRRKAEDTSRSVVFPGLFYAVISLTVMLSAAIAFTYDDISIGYAAAVGFVISAVLSVLYIREKNKKIRTAVCSAVCFAGVLAFSVSFISAGQKSGGFGAEKRVPEISEIRNVSIYADNKLGFTDPIVLDDSESVGMVCSVHEKLAAAEHISCNEGNTVELSYYLKNGRQMVRIYRVQTEDYSELFDIYKYREKCSEIAEQNIKDGFSNYCRVYLRINGETFRCQDNPEISAAVSEIAEKYRTDMMRYENEFWRRDHSADSSGSIWINGYHVPESFAETVLKIEKYMDCFEKYNIYNEKSSE